MKKVVFFIAFYCRLKYAALIVCSYYQHFHFRWPCLYIYCTYIYKETDVFVPRRVYCALQYVPNGMAWCAVWCLTYGESRSTLCQYSSTWSLCAEISVYFSGNDGYFIAWCLCRVHGAESCVHGENVCPPSMMFVPCARCRVLNARGKCLPPYSMMFVPCTVHGAI